MKLTYPAAKKWHGGWNSYPGHKGQDFGWGDGDEVIAAAPGKVVEVYKGGGYNGGWGNRIVIKHADGVYTTYNHLATGTIRVKKGQKVTRGQRLATMGNTGESTAKHLHFELELNGRGPGYRVDPAPYYTKDLPGTKSDPKPAKPVALKPLATSGDYKPAKSGWRQKIRARKAAAILWLSDQSATGGRKYTIAQGQTVVAGARVTISGVKGTKYQIAFRRESVTTGKTEAHNTQIASGKLPRGGNNVITLDTRRITLRDNQRLRITARAPGLRRFVIARIEYESEAVS